MPRKSPSTWLLIGCAAVAMTALTPPVRAGLTSITLPTVALAEDARMVASPAAETPTGDLFESSATEEERALWLPASYELTSPSNLMIPPSPAELMDLPPTGVRQQYVVPLPPAVITGSLMLAGNWIGLRMWKKRRI
jgi:hypothetical protein